MIGLIKMLWKFAWLTVFILGARRAIEIAQGWLNDVVDRIEEGEAGPTEGVLVRLHEALHVRQAHRGETSLDDLRADGVGERSVLAS